MHYKSDHNRVEKAMKESERRWLEVIDFLPDSTMAINLEGKVIAWNPAMEEMTGLKAEEILGKGNYEYVLPFCGKRMPILVDFIVNPKTEKQVSYPRIERRRDCLVMEIWSGLRGKKAFLWCKASPLFDSKGHMIGAIESIRDMTEWKQREKDLKSKEEELRNLNTALRILLEKQEELRSELEHKILTNMKSMVQPLLEKLKNQTGQKGKSYIHLIESNLKDIISPFACKLTVSHLNLTNKEIQVANLIREDKTTKEIAEIINISESAVNVYRHHIRKKCGLNKKQNLNSYLATLASN